MTKKKDNPNLYPLGDKPEIETPNKLDQTVIEFKPDCKYLFIINVPVDWFPDLSRLQKDATEKLDQLLDKGQYEVLVTRGETEIEVMEVSDDGN